MHHTVLDTLIYHEINCKFKIKLLPWWFNQGGNPFLAAANYVCGIFQLTGLWKMTIVSFRTPELSFIQNSINDN